MVTHCSILVWRIPWTEEPGGLHTVHRVARSWTRLEQLSTHACLVVNTQCFHCMGLHSNPGWGTKIPQAMWHNQKNKLNLWKLNTVLVCSEARWLINNRCLFLIDLEAGKSKIQVPADSVSDDRQTLTSWLIDSHLLSDPSHGRGARGFCGVSFIKEH